MNEINRSPDLEMVVLKEISSAIVNERNGTALLRHILDVLYRRMKMLRGTFTIRRGNDLMIEASHGLDEQEMKTRAITMWGKALRGMWQKRAGPM